MLVCRFIGVGVTDGTHHLAPLEFTVDRLTGFNLVRHLLAYPHNFATMTTTIHVWPDPMCLMPDDYAYEEWLRHLLDTTESTNTTYADWTRHFLQRLELNLSVHPYIESMSPLLVERLRELLLG